MHDLISSMTISRGRAPRALASDTARDGGSYRASRQSASWPRGCVNFVYRRCLDCPNTPTVSFFSGAYFPLSMFRPLFGMPSASQPISASLDYLISQTPNDQSFESTCRKSPPQNRCNCSHKQVYTASLRQPSQIRKLPTTRPPSTTTSPRPFPSVPSIRFHGLLKLQTLPAFSLNVATIPSTSEFLLCPSILTPTRHGLSLTEDVVPKDHEDRGGMIPRRYTLPKLLAPVK